MKLRPSIVVVCALQFVPAVYAAGSHPTYDDLWNQASQRPGCSVQALADFTLVDCGLTFYYFTKPNHPAHPGVIERTITQQADGSWVASEHGSSFGTDASQPAFKAWLAQIADLDRQMTEEIARRHNAAPPNK